MGRRITKLSCQACSADWWEKFEQFDRSEVISFATETDCPDCDAHDWILTNRSRFSGGPIHPNPPDSRGGRIRTFTCNDCRSEFHAWVGELTATELAEFAQHLTCPDCESHDWRLRDGYKFVQGANPEAPIYYSMANELDAAQP